MLIILLCFLLQIQASTVTASFKNSNLDERTLTTDGTILVPESFVQEQQKENSIKKKRSRNSIVLANFPSVRRNIRCINSKLTIESLKGGDGVYPNLSLWILPTNCELGGIIQNYASPFFIPTLKEVNITTDGAKSTLDIGGELLLPCNLSFFIIVTNKESNNTEEHNSTTYACEISQQEKEDHSVAVVDSAAVENRSLYEEVALVVQFGVENKFSNSSAYIIKEANSQSSNTTKTETITKTKTDNGSKWALIAFAIACGLLLLLLILFIVLCLCFRRLKKKALSNNLSESQRNEKSQEMDNEKDDEDSFGLGTSSSTTALLGAKDGNQSPPGPGLNNDKEFNEYVDPSMLQASSNQEIPGLLTDSQIPGAGDTSAEAILAEVLGNMDKNFDEKGEENLTNIVTNEQVPEEGEVKKKKKKKKKAKKNAEEAQAEEGQAGEAPTQEVVTDVKEVPLQQSELEENKMEEPIEEVPKKKKKKSKKAKAAETENADGAAEQAAGEGLTTVELDYLMEADTQEQTVGEEVEEDSSKVEKKKKRRKKKKHVEEEEEETTLE